MTLICALWDEPIADTDAVWLTGFDGQPAPYCQGCAMVLAQLKAGGEPWQWLREKEVRPNN